MALDDSIVFARTQSTRWLCLCYQPFAVSVETRSLTRTERIQLLFILLPDSIDGIHVHRVYVSRGTWKDLIKLMFHVKLRE